MWRGVILCGMLTLLIPELCAAQRIAGWAEDVKSLHTILEQIYEEMIPKCDQLISVGRGLAAFGALWFIAARVWGHIARVESVDFYPLFRPFVIGFCILIFPAVIGLINGVMKPTVTGTAAMVEQSDEAIKLLLKEKEEKIKQSDFYIMYHGPNGSGNYDEWYRYTFHEEPSEEHWWDAIGNNIKFAMSKAFYNFKNAVKEVMAEILQLFFAAASLTINTMRTFNLIILAILGPLAFGLSVFDGFGSTLKHWLARYINVFLWLPVANIFGAVIGTIQENMLKIDIGQVSVTGDTFFSRTDLGYMIFLIIGIIGYFTVPSIANQIIWVGGGDALTGKATNAGRSAVGMAGAATGAAGGMAGAVAGRAMTTAGNILKSPYHMYEGYSGKNEGQGMAADVGKGAGHAGSYLFNKLRGLGKKSE